MRNNNANNLQHRSAWKRLVAIFSGILFLPVILLVVISSFVNPSNLNFLYSWQGLIALVLFVLLFCLRVFRAIHEGLHAIAAHWFGVPSSLISAKDVFVFVIVTDKQTWYKITLYPLLFPFALFLLFLPWNWQIGLLLSSVLATGSSQDLANLVMVSHTKGNWVSDTAEGLFVFETPPDRS